VHGRAARLRVRRRRASRGVWPCFFRRPRVVSKGTRHGEGERSVDPRLSSCATERGHRHRGPRRPVAREAGVWAGAQDPSPAPPRGRATCDGRDLPAGRQRAGRRWGPAAGRAPVGPPRGGATTPVTGAVLDVDSAFRPRRMEELVRRSRGGGAGNRRGGRARRSERCRCAPGDGPCEDGAGTEPRGEADRRRGGALRCPASRLLGPVHALGLRRRPR